MMSIKKKSAKRSYGALLIEALEEAVAIEQGRAKPVRVTRLTARKAAAAPAPVFAGHEIVALRTAIGFSQALFADALNVSVETIRSWEQDRRPPSGAALRLLELVAKHPDWVREGVALRSNATKVAESPTAELRSVAAAATETLRMANALLAAQVATTTLNSSSASGQASNNAALLFGNQRAGSSVSDESLKRPVH